MRTLVTGGTGLIGSAYLRRHPEDELFVLTRDARRARKLLPAAVYPVETLDELPAHGHWDLVLNLAGAGLADKRWTPARKQELVTSRVDFTHQLVRWMRNNPPETLISGSAIGYYGARDEQPISEQGAPTDEFQSRLCEQWELAASPASELGTRVCLLRTGVVIAAHGGALARMLTPFRLGLGGRLGGGEQYMSWIHISDLLAAIDFLTARGDLDGPFNACAPNPVSNREFSRQLAQALHRPAVLPMPGFALRLLIGEMAELLLSGQRVVPTRLLEAGLQFRYPELAGALRATLAPGHDDMGPAN